MNLVILAVILSQWVSRECFAENYRSPISSLECPEVDFEPVHVESGTPSFTDKSADVLSHSIVAAQLLDFYKKSVLEPEKTHKPSSALVLALESQTDQASVENAIHTAQKYGTCMENSKLQKELEKEGVEKPDQFLAELHSLVSKNPREFDLAKIFSERSRISGQASEANCVSCGAPATLESNAMKIIMNSEPLMDRKRVVLRILESVAHSCTGANRNGFAGLPDPTVKSISNTVELYSIIQDRFGSESPVKKQPLALNICKPVLEKGRSYSGAIRPSQGKENAGCASPADAIAVAVYGSRRDSRTGHCELKMKSLSGPGCQDHSAEWPCKNGNLWVDIETLGRNSYKAVYLNPQNP